MTNHLYEKIYLQTQKFLDAINLRDSEVLLMHFKVSETVQNEVYEVLSDYFYELPVLGLPSREMAFNTNRLNKPVFDVFVMDDGLYGVDVSLWVNESEVEPILHMDFIEQNGEATLRYRYIGS